MQNEENIEKNLEQDVKMCSKKMKIKNIYDSKTSIFQSIEQRKYSLEELKEGLEKWQRKLKSEKISAGITTSFGVFASLFLLEDYWLWFKHSANHPIVFFIENGLWLLYMIFLEEIYKEIILSSKMFHVTKKVYEEQLTLKKEL